MYTHSGIDDLYPSDSSRGFIRGDVITEGNPVVKQPLAYTLWALPGHPQMKRAWGIDLKNAMRDLPRILPVISVMEDLPMESNRVDLDPDTKDVHGLPAPRMTHKQHPNDIVMNRWFEDKMTDIAAATTPRSPCSPTHTGSRTTSCRRASEAIYE
jgi:hypothetical protein